jgi:hypothetical protein
MTSQNQPTALLLLKGDIVKLKNFPNPAFYGKVFGLKDGLVLCERIKSKTNHTVIGSIIYTGTEDSCTFISREHPATCTFKPLFQI